MCEVTKVVETFNGVDDDDDALSKFRNFKKEFGDEGVVRCLSQQVLKESVHEPTILIETEQHSCWASDPSCEGDSRGRPGITQRMVRFTGRLALTFTSHRGHFNLCD